MVGHSYGGGRKTYPIYLAIIVTKPMENINSVSVNEKLKSLAIKHGVK
ncbi:MAG: hypothetical protein ACXW09_15180 [Methylococcaceae bacterium]